MPCPADAVGSCTQHRSVPLRQGHIALCAGPHSGGDALQLGVRNLEGRSHVTPACPSNAAKGLTLLADMQKSAPIPHFPAVEQHSPLAQDPALGPHNFDDITCISTPREKTAGRNPAIQLFQL